MLSDSEEEDDVFPRSSPHQNRTPRKMYLLAVLAGLGGFLFGYDTGVVSGAIMLVRSELNLSSVWHEVLVSGTIGAAFCTAVLSGSLADRFGRRPAILLASIHFASGSLVMALAGGKEVLLVGRLLVGVGVGLASTVVPLYIGECSSPELRGYLVTLNIAAVTFGQLVAGVICGLFANTDNGWRYMLGLAMIPALLQLLLFYFMPESPRYLVQRGKLVEAENVLSSIRSPYHQVKDELEDIQISCNQSCSVSMLEFLRTFPFDRHGKRSVFLGCLLQLVQQFAGINTVMYYAASIVKMAGASDTLAIWFSAITAAFNFIFTLVGLRLVVSLTRRRLLFVSMGCVVLSLMFISSSFYFLGDNREPNSTVTVDEDVSKILTEDDQNTGYSGPVLILISLSLYIAAFAPGMGPLPWTINSELHPVWCRAHAQSLSTATNWIGNLVVSLTFLSLVDVLGRPLTFLVYATATMLCGIILYYLLPESKDVKLEEVASLFDPQVPSADSGRILYSRLPGLEEQ